MDVLLGARGGPCVPGGLDDGRYNAIACTGIQVKKVMHYLMNDVKLVFSYPYHRFNHFYRLQQLDGDVLIGVNKMLSAQDPSNELFSVIQMSSHI